MLVLRETTTLGNLDPGEYVITAEPVRVQTDTYYPTVDPSTVRLKAGDEAAVAVKVSYFSIIPSTTRLLTPAETANVVVEPDAKLAFAPGTTPPIVGDVLVAPVSGRLPFGLAKKVISVAVRPNGTVVAETAVAQLNEIARRGDVSAQVPLTLPTITPSSTPVQAPSERRPAAGNALSQLPQVNCQSQFGVTITPSVSFTNPSVNFAASWNQGLITGSVTASMTASMGIRVADLSGGVSCSVDLLPTPPIVGSFVLLIPGTPIPVLFLVRFNPSISVEATIGSGETLPLLELAGTANLGAGLSVLGTVATPVNLTNATLTPPSFDITEVAGTATVGFNADVEVIPAAAAIFSALGIPVDTPRAHVGLQPYASYTHNDPSAPVCWQVDGGVNFNAGFDIIVTDLVASASLVGPIRIVDSAGPCTGPTISTTSLPNATVGQSYAASLAASGGRPPYHWESFGSPKMPPGLVLNPNLGTIGGTPTTAGAYSILFEVTDSEGHSDTQTIVISVEQRCVPVFYNEQISGNPQPGQPFEIFRIYRWSCQAQGRTTIVQARWKYVRNAPTSVPEYVGVWFDDATTTPFQRLAAEWVAPPADYIVNNGHDSTSYYWWANISVTTGLRVNGEIRTFDFPASPAIVDGFGP